MPRIIKLFNTRNTTITLHTYTYKANTTTTTYHYFLLFRYFSHRLQQLISPTAIMGMSTDIKAQEPPSKDEVSNVAATERPPSYTSDEELLLNFPKLNLSDTKKLPPTVTRDQCVAHLKFLAILADLRDFVSSNDGLFGIFDSQADSFPHALNEARTRIREKRWAVYTARAVERYRKWWFTCLPMSRPHVTLSDLVNPRYEVILDCETLVLWSEENLPPLGKQRRRFDDMIRVRLTSV